MDQHYFSQLLPQLAERSRSAALSRLGFAHVPLYRHLNEIFSQPFGETGSFLADPTFEATFGWKESRQTMLDLAGSSLTEKLVEAMDQPPKELANEYRFGMDRHPYEHQLNAWEILGSSEPQSLVVASGTGSGKTECFMVPILDRLAQQQAESDSRLIGVRALFLYPLNALINSQRERLRAWTHQFDGNVRFCLFNGNTPDKVQAHKKREYPSEVMDRESLRASPPPILVTNATMLEYMLVRTADTPILQKSQGKLEWIVLDEAHTYIGSQAAELALLIRRVLHAFGVHPDQVRFVATSATIGNPNGEAGEKLKRFLAQVAGVSHDRVHLVAGKRQIDPLPEKVQTKKLSLDDLISIESDIPATQPAPNRYAALEIHPTARALQRLFLNNEKRNQESGGSGMVARLSEVCKTVCNSSEKPTREQQTTALVWLDLLSATKNSKEIPFLPLRAHLFHQTVSGIWACSDPHCPDKAGSHLESDKWPFGQVYLEPRKHCHCNSPAYELVACDDCGAPHLLAAERGDRLLHPKGYNAVDEFELELESDEELLESEEEEQEDDEKLARSETKILIVNRTLPGTAIEIIEKQSRQYCEAQDEENTLRLTIQGDSGDGLSCPCCGGGEEGNRRRRLFQEARIGAPFSLGIILPTLLEYAPDGDRPAEHPYRGRRLLTFNDSRQGTARIAAKLQQESERNRIRGLVYHLAIREGAKHATAEAKKLEDEISEFEQNLAHVPKQGKAFFEKQLNDKREQLAKLSQPTPISFDDMSRMLANHGNEFDLMLNHYRKDVSYESFSGDTGGIRLAQMFLVREFGRRPKRLNSLESMGLVSVSYPALNNITRSHPGFKLDEWSDFLKICLDFFIRSGGSLEIDKVWRNWLGMPFPQTWLVEQKTIEKTKYDRRWPRAQYILKKGKKKPNHRSTLVRLLAHHLNADIETSYGEDIIDAALVAAWKVLTEETGLLKSAGSGRRVLPLDQLAFSPISSAWICPVTRRFLDTTLNGVTPYLPFNHSEVTRRCTRKKIPLYDKPFGGDDAELSHIANVRRWLDKQDPIEQLREEGFWPVLNDRAIELSPYFVTGEHSAQQPSDRLARYEKAFKEGDLNLLSCSTTMEMGIDIGGIAMVAMNNVPPNPANYLQRAGRAGRRKEARSVALTLCKSNPHDQIVYSNTDWPFVTKLPAPVVSLNSEIIVQRHVNSLVLTHFLAERVNASDSDASKLTCGWFFAEPEGATPADHFVAWCEASTHKDSPLLSSGLSQLTKHSCYEDKTLKHLVRGVAAAMKTALEVWLTEWGNLSKQERLTREGGENNPAYKATKYQKGRMAGEYLLRELATQGFLPAYGFPTHIAAFENMTLSQAKKLRREYEGNKGREDNNFRPRELASRDRVSALREYAPGAEIVMDGLVYRSSGITLNWHAPANQQQARETQAIKYAWRCHVCNHSGSSRQRDSFRHCSECDTEVKKENIQTFLEPAGFSVDFYSDPDNDVTTQEFIPVEPPWVSASGDWLYLPNPNLGQYRTTSRGHIFHQSKGVHGDGYAVCLACGRAEPMSGDSVPGKLIPHNKLRGGRGTKGGEGKEECLGSHEDYVIQTGVALGHEEFTDVLEIQLRYDSGIWLSDLDAARTLAVVLRDSLAELLGIQANELGCDIKNARTDSNSACRSILIYDRHAAGYASNARDHIEELFRVAHKRLHCPVQCDSACPHCVLDFDQRFNADNLNRYAALKLLTPEWLNSLKLPEEMCYFGPMSRVETSGLVEAVLRVSRHSGGSGKVRFYVGGSPNEWDIGPSPLRLLIYQLAARELKVEIVIEKHCFDALEDVDRQLLASLVDYPGSVVSICLVEGLPKAGGASVLAELLEGEQAYRWAIEDTLAVVFGLSWESSNSTLIVGNKLKPLVIGSEIVTAQQLRLDFDKASDKEVEVLHELDGPLQGFGRRFWGLMTQSNPSIDSLLLGADADIVGISYHDRYLFSPLSAALLVELISGLRDVVGNQQWGNPAIIITTTKEPSGSYRQRRFVWDNWPDMRSRDKAITHALDHGGMAADIRSIDKRSSQHGRTFEVQFSSKQVLTVRLDQGVSYWRASSSSHGKNFDFQESDLSIQGERVAELALDVESSTFPTHLFTKVRR